MNLTEKQIAELPHYASFSEDGRVVVDIAVAYPEVLEETKLAKDQFGAEVVRRVITERLKRQLLPYNVVEHGSVEAEDGAVTAYKHVLTAEPVSHEQACMLAARHLSNPRVMLETGDGVLVLRLTRCEEWALKNLPSNRQYPTPERLEGGVRSAFQRYV